MVKVSRQAFLEQMQKLSTSDDIFVTDSDSEDGDWVEMNSNFFKGGKGTIAERAKKN